MHRIIFNPAAPKPTTVLRRHFRPQPIPSPPLPRNNDHLPPIFKPQHQQQQWARSYHSTNPSIITPPLRPLPQLLSRRPPQPLHQHRPRCFSNHRPQKKLEVDEKALFAPMEIKLKPSTSTFSFSSPHEVPNPTVLNQQPIAGETKPFLQISQFSNPSKATNHFNSQQQVQFEKYAEQHPDIIPSYRVLNEWLSSFMTTCKNDQSLPSAFKVFSMAELSQFLAASRARHHIISKHRQKTDILPPWPLYSAIISPYWWISRRYAFYRNQWIGYTPLSLCIIALSMYIVYKFNQGQ